MSQTQSSASRSATLPIPEVIPPFPTRRKAGRPSKFDQATADEICLRLSEGEGLKRICREEWAPTFHTVYNWLKVHEGFKRQYAEARGIGLENMAEELLEIADDGSNDWMLRNDPDNAGYAANGEHLKRSELRIKTRQWLLSKLAPARYGDRLKAELTGADGGPIQTESLSDLTIARRIAMALQSGVEQLSSEETNG